MFLVVPAAFAGLAISLLAPGPAFPAPAPAPPASDVDTAPRLLSAEFFGMHAISSPPAGIPGVASVRLWDTDTTWRVLNPRPGVYHWRTLDQRVDSAERSGASVLLVLGATPPWAARSLDPADAPWLGSGTASPPRRMSAWTDFVSAVAARYSGRIEAYQVWNEPADRLFWRGSAATLARMTRLAFDRIRVLDPAAQVVAAPFLVRQRDWEVRASAYLRALRTEGWPVDVLAFHGYATGTPGPAAHREVITRMRAFLQDSQAPALPLWETEVNFPESPGIAPRVSAATERSWLARTYLDAARLGVDRVYWYAYAAVPAFLAVDIRRPAVSSAFKSVSAWMTGAFLLGCLDDWHSVAGVTGCSFVDRAGHPAVALWSARPRLVGEGRGRVIDLEGRAWSVASEVPVSSSPIWFAPSTRPS